ncbi:unnamed protein product [Prunus armeniaca]|uniref:Uncharacterized protein n=1 Tax=Prunus armeniaca TaxID=36596 RepID=A0A6J5TG63_PRUAR|nr:unnamed protein product [Prunus armeniaca]
MIVYTAIAAGVVTSPRPKEEIYKEISMFECGSKRCNVGLKGVQGSLQVFVKASSIFEFEVLSIISEFESVLHFL